MAVGNIRSLASPVTPRARWTVQQALEWAFATELAQLDLSDDCSPDFGLPTFGAEYLMMQRAELGGMRIDTSPGRSRPHDDAEIIAGVVLSLKLGGKWMAIRVSEYARARTVPEWGQGMVPAWQPKEWRQGAACGRGGITGKAEATPPDQWARFTRQMVSFTPCHLTPSPSQIASKQAFYLDWWWALREIYHKLKRLQFKAFDLIDGLPAARPWKTC